VARIEDYALIGDLQTAALVDREGSIDWCCFPRFDSGACFAALLGTPDHGRWVLSPTSPLTGSSRAYKRDTLVLESTYETAEGVVRAIDFMPPRGKQPDIVRIVEGVEGFVPMRSELVIRFDYGQIVPWVRRVDHARVAIAGPDALCFRTPVEVHVRRRPQPARQRHPLDVSVAHELVGQVLVLGAQQVGILEVRVRQPDAGLRPVPACLAEELGDGWTR